MGVDPSPSIKTARKSLSAKQGGNRHQNADRFLSFSAILYTIFSFNINKDFL
jgi:hypothetical protein